MPLSSSGVLAFIVSVSLLVAVVPAQTTPSTQPHSENEKIELLIFAVEQLHDATFIRNDVEYDCKAAAKHLRSKWDYARKKIKTAQQFIEYIGTQSSQSGKPYRIRFKDGTELPSKEFFTRELKKLD